jgi:hypothetical protein
MPTTWTLTVGGDQRTLAAWGISGLTRRRSSQAADVVGFDVTVPVDAAAPFAHDDVVSISRDGVGWFTGRITGLTRSATGRSEVIAYRVSGPWWYLDQLVYQQVWTVFGTGLQVKKSHALINTWADGTSMGVRAQINEALEWARSRAEAAYGASPFQWISDGFPEAQIPADEVRDITVAEVVRKQLRWIPDAVTWFDYATTPPTLHVARRTELPTRTVSVPGSDVSDLVVTPRQDLRVPSVVLKYERVDTVDGASVPVLATDIAPGGATGEEFGALCATIDLQGFSASYATAYVGTAAWPTTTAGWWTWLKSREPVLRRAEFVLDQVIEVGRTRGDDGPGSLMPRELIEGQVPEWMGAVTSPETVRVKAKIKVYASTAPGAELLETVTKEFAVNVVGTDATTGTYRQLTSASSGEAAPIGLAQVLYDALGVLEHEGSITITAEDLPAPADEITIGTRLSITGLRPEWADMAALVQDVVESIDDGTVSIRFGPPQHLGSRDLVELLRVNRFRFVYTASSARAGTSSGSGGIGLGRGLPKENSGSGSGQRERLLLRAGAGAIELDASMAGNMVVTLKEVSICINGEEKRMLLLASEPY